MKKIIVGLLLAASTSANSAPLMEKLVHGRNQMYSYTGNDVLCTIEDNKVTLKYMRGNVSLTTSTQATLDKTNIKKLIDAVFLEKDDIEKNKSVDVFVPEHSNEYAIYKGKTKFNLSRAAVYVGNYNNELIKTPNGEELLSFIDAICSDNLGERSVRIN